MLWSFRESCVTVSQSRYEAISGVIADRFVHGEGPSSALAAKREVPRKNSALRGLFPVELSNVQQNPGPVCCRRLAGNGGYRTRPRRGAVKTVLPFGVGDGSECVRSCSDRDLLVRDRCACAV